MIKQSQETLKIESSLESTDSTGITLKGMPRRTLLRRGLLVGSGMLLAGSAPHVLAEKSNKGRPGKDTSETAPTRYIETQGTRYAYRRFGNEAGVPILLLQHFRGTMDDWDPKMIDGLAKTRPVILFDNAGVGSSGGTVPDNVSDMAHHVAIFTDGLKLKQIDLLGFSLGGFIAQQLLLDRPDLYRRAILAGTGPQGGKGMQSFTPAVAAAATKYPTDGSERKFLFFGPSVSSQAAGDDFLQRIRTRTIDRDPVATVPVMQGQGKAIGAWGAASNDDYISRLKEIRVPVLVVNGSDDIMIPSVNAFDLSQHIPSAQLILYPDAGHGALFQYAELFVAHANLFLS